VPGTPNFRFRCGSLVRNFRYNRMYDMNLTYRVLLHNMYKVNRFRLLFHWPEWWYDRSRRGQRFPLRPWCWVERALLDRTCGWVGQNVRSAFGASAFLSFQRC